MHKQVISHPSLRPPRNPVSMPLPFFPTILSSINLCFGSSQYAIFLLSVTPFALILILHHSTIPFASQSSQCAPVQSLHHSVVLILMLLCSVHLRPAISELQRKKKTPVPCLSQTAIRPTKLSIHFRLDIQCRLPIIPSRHSIRPTRLSIRPIRLSTKRKRSKD
jgi:hypothetical protein